MTDDDYLTVDDRVTDDCAVRRDMFPRPSPALHPEMVALTLTTVRVTGYRRLHPMCCRAASLTALLTPRHSVVCGVRLLALGSDLEYKFRIPSYETNIFK